MPLLTKPTIFTECLHLNIISFLKENIRKSYKSSGKATNINQLGSESIATKLNLMDRIEKVTEVPAYVTLKYHKENFRSKPSCRLISPCKNEIEKISKIV